MEKYFKHCWKLAIEFYNKYPSLDITIEDYYSIACETIITTLSRFNLNSTNFYKYWKVCAQNNLRTFVKRYYDEKKYSPFSFDYQYDVGGTLHDYIGYNDQALENNLLVESFASIINDPINRFTKNEKIVIEYILNGYDIEQIAIMINKSRATIYRHYRKAVEKIRHILSKVK